LAVIVNTSEIAAFADAVKSLASAVDTPAMHRHALNALAELSRKGFYDWIDSRAASKPDKLGHMYDWGKIGEKDGRLFQLIYSNRGTNELSARVVSKPSKEPVPIREPLKREHVFINRAEMEELGKTVTIRRLEAEMLAWWENGIMKFSKGPIQRTLTNYAGQFQKAWGEYWSSEAPKNAEAAMTKAWDRYMKSKGQAHVRKTVASAKVKPRAAKSKNPTVEVVNDAPPAPKPSTSSLVRDWKNG